MGRSHTVQIGGLSRAGLLWTVMKAVCILITNGSALAGEEPNANTQ